MDLIFLDTETTGLSPFEDWLVQVCYSVNGKIYSEYFKPSVPISIKAQSIHHITNKMVADKGSFKESKMKKDLTKLLKTKILVAHNAPFDINMISREGIEVPQFICTFKIARLLDEEYVIPEYNLQYLRYYFELDIKAEAHNAKGDVLVLEGVFNKLYEKMLLQLKDPKKVIAKMIEVSREPWMFKLFPFGKYKGRKIEEIMVLDRSYLEWLLNSKTDNPYGEEDWIFTLKHHLGGNI